jgi:hypothetical protein
MASTVAASIATFTATDSIVTSTIIPTVWDCSNNVTATFSTDIPLRLVGCSIQGVDLLTNTSCSQVTGPVASTFLTDAPSGPTFTAGDVTSTSTGGPVASTLTKVPTATTLNVTNTTSVAGVAGSSTTKPVGTPEPYTPGNGGGKMPVNLPGIYGLVIALGLLVTLWQ